MSSHHDASLPGAPFVGMRPFDHREQAVFFGRDRESNLLLDRILANRLTVLYARSGVGKSSLLRVRVIPELEAEDALVLYHDSWSGESPADAFRLRLIELATSCGLPHAEAGAPTLKDLATIISAHTSRTLVLVLDQFEEFLFHHANHLDPLRKELGALIRDPGVDARVVLSLREEFLASLEPFRPEMVDLFQSTYRLEPLSGQGLRDAIRKPVEVFGEACDDDLVDRLVTDLKSEPAPGGEEAADQVELPFLQLVCRELWRMGPEAGGRFDLATYASHGGVRGILEGYLRAVMPDTLWARRRHARFIQYLAPPSGLKMSYAAKDLAPHIRGGTKRLVRELDALAAHRLLHVRDHRGELRYELQHDALIQVLRTWREKVLSQLFRWKVLAGFGLLALVVLVSALGIHGYRQHRIGEEQEKRIESLEKETYGAVERAEGLSDSSDLKQRILTAAFDQAALVVLSPDASDEVRSFAIEFLKKKADLIPKGYGRNEDGMEFLLPPNESWSFRLEVSSERKLDARIFNGEWQRRVLAEVARGYPLPRRIAVVSRAEFPRQTVRLVVSDMTSTSQVIEDVTSTSLDLPDLEEKVSIVCLDNEEKELPERIRRHGVDAFREITPIEGSGSKCWSVEDWSIPLWKMSGVEVFGNSAYAARQLAARVHSLADIFLTDEALARILRLPDDLQPATPEPDISWVIREALASRGLGLRNDILTLLKTERLRVLGNANVLLDTLSEFSGPLGPDQTQQILARLEGGKPPTPDRLHGPWREAVQLPSRSKALGTAYEEWNLDEEAAPPIRLEIGSKIVTWWVNKEPGAGKRERAPEVREAIEEVIEEFRSRVGVSVPIPELTEDRTLSPESMRILFFGADSDPKDPEPIPLMPDSNLETLRDELLQRLVGRRFLFVNADSLQVELQKLEPRVRDWLLARYSLTDLKVLVRAMLDPPAARGLPRLDRLLKSLAFWSQVGDPMDTRGILSFWRQIQAETTRLEEAGTPDAEAVVDRLLAPGLGLLDRGDLAGAASRFAVPANVSPTDWTSRFARAFAWETWKETWFRIRNVCGRNEAESDDESRLDLVRWFRAGAGTTSMEDEADLEFCLLRQLASGTRPRRFLDAAARYVSKHREADTWPVEDAFRFGEWVLKTWTSRFADPSLLDFTADLLESAARRCEPAHKDLLDNLLMVDLKDVCPRGQGILLDLIASHGNSAAKAQAADRIVGSLQDRPGWLRLAVNWAQAQAGSAPDDPMARVADLGLVRLARHGEPDVLPEALARIRSRYEAKPSDRIWWSELGDLLVYSGQPPMIREGLRLLGAPPDDEDQTILWAAGARLIGNLILVQRDGIEEVARQCVERAESSDRRIKEIARLLARMGKNNPVSVEHVEEFVRRVLGSSDQFTFIAAVAGILADVDKYEEVARRYLDTNHDSTDYVRILLAAIRGMSEIRDAKNYLEKRWLQATPTTWQWRLRDGNPTAWREMLIGYVSGNLERGNLFDDLEDADRFKRSDLRHLSMGRDGLLCEGYFYEAMKFRLEGDLEACRDSLRKAFAINVTSYYEHWLAHYLLNSESFWRKADR